MEQSISVIIPAYNDQVTIEEVVSEAIEIVSGLATDYEIFIVNDDSRDGTGALLDRLTQADKAIRVVHHETNRGYGATIAELYMGAKGDLVFSLPGDGQLRARELLKMLPAIQDHDIVIGRRRERQDPFTRKVYSFIYNSLIRILYGLTVRDINSIKLIKREVLEHIRFETTSAFTDAELCIRASRLGYSIGEVDIEHLARQFGEALGGNKFVGFKIMWDTFVDSIRMWKRLRDISRV
jgi:glycosyltransferase involved in cell wall biosynthesis